MSGGRSYFALNNVGSGGGGSGGSIRVRRNSIDGSTRPSRSFAERTYWISVVQMCLVILAVVGVCVIVGLLIWNVVETMRIRKMESHESTNNGGSTATDMGPLFDYIFVGTGATASVAVRRLSDAHPELRILMLEYGKNRNSDGAVTNAFRFVEPGSNPKYSRSFMTVPDPNLFFQQTGIQTGNMIGGSSNHDYMQTVYPSQSFCDNVWAGLGGPFWNWQNTQRRLKRSETFLGPANAVRGTDGLLTVLSIPFEEQGSTADQMAHLVGQAFSTADSTVPVVADYNLGQSTSVSLNAQQWWIPVQPEGMNRSSPGIHYLGAIINDDGSGKAGGHENLTVLTEALVDKVLFDASRRAYAVRYIDRHGRTQHARASREIVLSAGAVYTPGILERSGYGSPDLLAELGIEVVYPNSFVGERLKNQPSPLFAFEVNETLFNPYAFASFQSYLSVLPESNGERTMQLLGSAAFAALLSPTAQVLLGLPPNAPAQLVAMFAFMLTPRSEGSVHIVSRVPNKEPLLMYNTYSDETDYDLRTNVEAMRALRKLVQLQAAQDPAHTYTIVYPTSAAWDDASNATLKAQIKASNIYSAHWAQTCMMGPAGEGVVDPTLHVQSVQGLRIADVSVLPITPSNTRSMAISIGEALSEMLISEIESA